MDLFNFRGSTVLIIALQTPRSHFRREPRLIFSLIITIRRVTSRRANSLLLKKKVIGDEIRRGRFIESLATIEAYKLQKQACNLLPSVSSPPFHFLRQFFYFSNFPLPRPTLVFRLVSSDTGKNSGKFYDVAAFVPYIWITPVITG